MGGRKNGVDEARARETDCHYVLSNHTVEKGRFLVVIFSSLISSYLPFSLSLASTCVSLLSIFSSLGHEDLLADNPTHDDAPRSADPGLPFM